MGNTWYRIQDADRDPQALLDPENWVSRTWNPQQVFCRCEGYDEECATCGGNGYYDEPARRGVSVCPTITELARYAENTAMDLRDTVLIELAGDVSDDEDQDNGHGYECRLLLPSAVITVTPIDELPEFADQLAWDEANR